MTYRWSPHSTVSAWMIASVSGMVSRQTVPSPSVESTLDRAADRSMLVLTTSMPTPRPDTLVTLAGGGEAGLEDQRHDVPPVHVGDLVAA